MTHGSSPAPSKTFYTTILTSEDGQTGIELKAASDKARLVVIAGEPLDQEIVQHGESSCSTVLSLTADSLDSAEQVPSSWTLARAS